LFYRGDEELVGSREARGYGEDCVASYEQGMMGDILDDGWILGTPLPQFPSLVILCRDPHSAGGLSRSRCTRTLGIDMVSDVSNASFWDVMVGERCWEKGS